MRRGLRAGSRVGGRSRALTRASALFRRRRLTRFFPDSPHRGRRARKPDAAAASRDGLCFVWSMPLDWLHWRSCSRLSGNGTTGPRRSTPTAKSFAASAPVAGFRSGKRAGECGPVVLRRKRFRPRAVGTLQRQESPRRQPLPSPGTRYSSGSASLRLRAVRRQRRSGLRDAGSWAPVPAVTRAFAVLISHGRRCWSSVMHAGRCLPERRLIPSKALLTSPPLR